MRALPDQKLNPKIKNVWRINDAIWIALVFVCLIVPFAIAVGLDAEWAGIVCIALVIAFVVLLVIFLVILPPIRYARWRYQLSDEYLDIAKGIIWRKRYIIPFIRVQNTDTRQGPILRAFKLASVTVSTAAGSHEIPGLDAESAEALRDRAAELARLAREDV
ncbi:MAG: PH domain-containing protein [Coriobacteriales bacterium]